MRDRTVLHCDLNNFFASVSLLSSPTVKDLPVAVCGNEEERHGIVLAKNEIAKSFGVKTAETIREAKAKCPDLVILAPDYKKYHEYSMKARAVYERYTDIIEPFGIDECWLDVTGSALLFGSGEEIAERIRKEIKRELGITVSIGVSFNKVFAKLGSDMKKPDGITVISRENFKEKVWRLPAGDLLFVGKKTATKLKESGIFTIGDLRLCDDAFLTRLLGKNGISLKQYALGEDNSPVVTPTEDDMPKSVGRSVTPDRDITDRETVWKIYLELAEDISRQLRKKGLYAGGITVHTRTTTLSVKETTRSFSGGINSALLIAQKGIELFDECYKWNTPLRSVGLRAVNLRDCSSAIQQDLFGESGAEEKIEKIEDSIQSVREKFGLDSIKRGRIVK